MDVSKLSNHFHVRHLDRSDVGKILSLCKKNVLYYRYCPPAVSKQSILLDMEAFPPGKHLSDKHYVGYFKDGALIAVMDLIEAYPDEKTAFIGFFMTDTAIQNKGIGSATIEEACSFLRGCGFTRVRLGWAKGNPQSEHFWHKCGFTETGAVYEADGYTVMIAQKSL